MRKTTLFIFFLLLLHIAHAQDSNKTIRWNIYYKTNEYRLSDEQHTALKNFLSVITHGKLRSVFITGYTDSVDSDQHNDTLSFNRAMEVKNFLTHDLGIEDEMLTVKWMGEKDPAADNNNEEGRQQNRRTNIIVYYQLGIPPAPSVSLCDADTTITYPQGTIITYNKCEYERIKNCLQVIEILTAEAINQNNMTTMTTDGQTLVSCGMIEVKLNRPCPDTCFTHPLVVLFPVSKNTGIGSCERCSKDAQVFLAAANGLWRATPEPMPIEIIDINGREYYKLTLKCPGKTNCDCRKPVARVKFKLKNRMRIDSVLVNYSCPMGSYRFINDGKYKNRIAASLPCLNMSTERMVTVVATTRAGQTVHIKYQPLDQFRDKWTQPSCEKQRSVVLRKFFFWKFYKAALYRKYKFYRKDFKE